MDKLLIDSIKQDYLNGVKRNEMLLKYNINWSSLYEIIRPCLKTKNGLSKEEEKLVISLYGGGMSSTEIGYDFGYLHKVITKVVSSASVPIRHDGNRKYSVNHNYFSEIDTPEKAYILGFIYADGYNSEKRRFLQLILQERDFDILQKIKTQLRYSGPIYLDESNNKKNKNWSKTYRLVIRSKQISCDLAKHGAVQNKSLILAFPTKLDDKLYRHFIRGYFDGDGCLFLASDRNNVDQVSIASTEQFCRHMFNYLKSKDVITGGGVYDSSAKNDVTKLIRFGGKRQVKRFCDWIYKDATIYLDRKHDAYINRFY